MGRIFVGVLSLALMSQGAWAAATTATANDHESALALAALVAENSPLLTADQKTVMALVFNGTLKFSFPKNTKISVQADSVVCTENHADITSHSCDLSFGKKKVTVKGRKAHEIYATIIEVGVPGDGAAGTVYEALSHLTCTIDPNAIQQEDGEGADCNFTPGLPAP